MIRLLAGDCRDVLPTLPAESVQCVVTSPPYLGLRDYGTALWDGGDATCQHIKTTYKPAVYADGKQAVGKSCMSWRGGERNQSEPYGDVCGKCGAVRVDRQIGLEATPDEYLATMVGVFREVRRVLRRDGTCWVNMGDSYCANGSTPSFGSSDGELRRAVTERGDRRVPSGLKPKDLLLMPARLALALQADGWWVRSDIIWHKPNPMPESVTDRCVSAHEHVFMLTKSARYFFDADAIRETSITNDPRRPYTSMGAKQLDGRDTWHSGEKRDGEDFSSRSCRNVWTIATHAYPDAHFATFPPELAERCIKAGTSERGCCAACGKPWQRITETAFVKLADRRPSRKAVQDGANMSDINSHNVMGYNDVTTTGWAPGCDHDAPTVPSTVLDPFAGAGTTLLVADRLQRDAIGIELNTAYTEMAMERCRQDAPLFTSFPPAEPPEDERMADLFQDMAAD